MNMPFMTLEGIYSFKRNLNQYVKYFSNPPKEWDKWINDKLGFNPFKDSRYPMPAINLDMSFEKPELTDAANVQLVYDNLKFLSDSEASDERIWAGLCMGPFREYVCYRWKIDSESSVRQHFFFDFGARRSLTRNAVSRLWWIGRLTYDKSRSDPYEFTKLVCKNQSLIVDVLERNTSNNLVLIRAFFNAVIEAVKIGCPQIEARDNIRELAKYLNLLGGVYILDCLPEAMITDKLLKKAKEICPPVQLTSAASLTNMQTV